MSKPIILIACLLAVGAFASTAGAASPRTIIKDCTNSVDGELAGRYSMGDLQKALKEVNGDVAEYTSCYDAIRNAMRNAGGNGDDGSGDDGGTGGDGGTSGDGGTGLGGTGGGAGTGTGGTGGAGTGTGGATQPPPAAPVAPQPGSSAPVKLASASVTPSIPAALDSSGHDLPPALIGFLALFGAGAVGVAATTIGRRVLARRRV